MGHEIYYTSAHEGLRPGQQGFCTVGASAGIPRPLWDRLESLSGYSHVSDGAGAGMQGGPVAWSHWLVQLGGRELSVLSRVCDAGLDYTQRTNSFAHHLALEPSDRAAAGPAWMLRQGGVMAPRWDGRVGAIARPMPLPKADSAPAICTAWQRATGDAGWAGVLAETATKNPRRPVCILFSLGDELLPLVAEALALLPAALRWQVTFNTYFTSLPGNATCAWRCCLAGTTAATEAVRHAAGWLTLDLANPAGLGSPPRGPWVEAARMGRPGPGGTDATRIAPPRSSVITPTPPAVIPFADRARTNTSSRAPDVLFANPSVASVAPEPPPLPPVAEPIGGSATPAYAASRVTNQALDVQRARNLEAPLIPVRRRPGRRWIMGICAVSLAFVGAGTWLELSAYRESANAGPAPGGLTPGVPASQSTGEIPVLPAPADPLPVAGTTARSSEPPTTVAAVPVPAVTPVAPVVSAVTQPIITPVEPPRQPARPAAIVLSAEVLPPAAPGAGIHDAMQAIPVAARELDSLRSLASLDIVFPGGRNSYSIHQEDISGTLSVANDARGPLRRVLKWHDVVNPTASADVASVALNLSAAGGPQIEISWRTGMLLKRPDISALARAILQQATLVASDARALRPQSLTFRPANALVLELAAAPSALTLPPMPPAILPRAGEGLAPGWQVTVGREAAGTDKHAADIAGWTLHFTRPVSPESAACDFAVRISLDWKQAQSTWADQRQSMQSAVASATSELQKIDADAEQANQYARTALPPLEQELSDAQAQLKRSNSELLDLGTTREEVVRRAVAARVAVRERRAKLKIEMDAILARRADADRNRRILAAAVEGYGQVRQVDIGLELPDGLRVGTLRVMQAEPATGAGDRK